MIRTTSPFRLTAHFHGWSRALALALTVSVALNFACVYALSKQAANFATPRIAMSAPNGMLLPVAASAFVWTPEIARDYLKKFLPILYTFSPSGSPSPEMWSPFIHPQLLKAAQDRFQKNQSRIQADGLNQTLFVRNVEWDADTESALVLGELRQLDRAGQLTRTPIHITVDLVTTSDPLNPYGHSIYTIH